MMLRDAGGGGGYGAGHDPCGFKGVRPRERDGELERAAGGAGARPRVSTSAADLFVAGTSVASKARAAGSLLRNLRLPGGGQEDGESRSWESELYQVWDVTSSFVHTEQTKLATRARHQRRYRLCAPGPARRALPGAGLAIAFSNVSASSPFARLPW